MTRPRILDLYCGAGGAAVGYHRAGWDVVGVDRLAQPRYPYPLVRDDALAFLDRGDACDFDAVHASPPCQIHSGATRRAPRRGQYVELIGATRRRLYALGKPYVIENVEDAAAFLLDPVRLCGSSCGLPELRRHRLFETNWPLLVPPCAHGVARGNRLPPNRSGRTTPARVVSIAGHGVRGVPVAHWRRATGIDWMTRDEIAQAVPPAYTELIGLQLLALLETP